MPVVAQARRPRLPLIKDKGFSKIPSRGYLAANTVPGAVSGWDAAYRYASTSMGHSLPWGSLLESATHYAQNGIPVSPSLHYWSVVNTDEKDTEFRDLQRFPEFSKTYLKPGGKAYEVG